MFLASPLREIRGGWIEIFSRPLLIQVDGCLAVGLNRSGSEDLADRFHPCLAGARHWRMDVLPASAEE